MKETIMKKLLAFIFRKIETSVVSSQADTISKLQSIIDEQSKTIASLKNESSSLAEQFYNSQTLAETDQVLNMHLDSVVVKQSSEIKQLKDKNIELVDYIRQLENVINEKNCLLDGHANLIEKYKLVLTHRS